jgi:hypothetical protein
MWLIRLIKGTKFWGGDVAALFSNRFQIIASPQTTRIVFGEGVGGQTINRHTAIVMPTSDAAELGRLLSDVTSKYILTSERPVS